VPQEIPATNKTRLELETRGLQSEALHAQARQPAAAGLLALSVNVGASELGTQTPLAKNVRDAALNEVDKHLIAQGLLDSKTKQVARPILDEIIAADGRRDCQRLPG